MRLSFSNIAWDVSEDVAVAELLAKNGVNAIDIAPGKYFPVPGETRDEDIRKVEQWWQERGIRIIGMQALLFGTTGLNVFGSAAIQTALLDHLEGLSRIAGALGDTKLTFGSPKNRDRSGLTDEQTMSMAVDFFGRLGDIAQKNGVIFCLEPNPASYGANFMMTSAETAQVVKQINHPSIKMQFDTGAVSMNGENPETVLADCAPLIGHIHLSEPDLKPLGDCGTNHTVIHNSLLKFLPGKTATIEMVATKDEPHLVSIERALALAVQTYRPEKVTSP